ncbi:MAG: sodium:solute symporter family protein [Planctomycetes bacterium]|nr:sodium:solute symporter family protein [Planctomycetota bacterium]
MTGLPFGPGALAVMGAYILSLLLIGAYAYSRQKEESLSDFYLAGRDMGLVVLFLTLYTTQYSGNTLVMFAGTAAEQGFAWLKSVHFMIAIIIGVMFLAPRLQRLSRRFNFVTPGDFLEHRYHHRGLTMLITLVMVFAAGNFAVAQLRAMGEFFAALSGNQLGMAYGVIGLALVMVIYESLGGMRSVAWTDAFQGVILIVVFAVLLVVLRQQFGPFGEATAILAESAPHLVQRPDADGLRNWLSWIVLFGGGAAVYPMALQRIYAARSADSLRRSLALMTVMPYLCTLVVFIAGIYAAAHLHPLPNRPDQVLPALCLQIVDASPIGYALVLALFAAVLAALMSTADSALLAMSSMLTRDVYSQYVARDRSQDHYARVGKIVSWMLMAVLVAIALADLPGLKAIMVIKLAVLVQAAPAFFLGVCSRARSQAVLAGLIAGLVTAVTLTLTDHQLVAGIHAGTIGLALNVLTVATISMIGSRWPRPQ